MDDEKMLRQLLKNKEDLGVQPSLAIKLYKEKKYARRYI